MHPNPFFDVASSGHVAGMTILVVFSVGNASQAPEHQYFHGFRAGTQVDRFFSRSFWPSRRNSMRYGTSLVTLIVALSVGAAPLLAQGRGNGQAKKPASTTQASGKNSAPKADHPAKADHVQAGQAKTDHVKADHVKADHVKAEHSNAASGKKTTAAPTTTTAVTPTTPLTPTTPTTQHIKNPKLEARLMALIPNLPLGTTIQDVAGGFKNWGQFVAAVHVSNNLGIPFADLKARMTGLPVPGMTPGLVVPTTPLSLGQAIQASKTTIPVTPTTTTLTPTTIQAEVKKAEDAANADLRRTRESN
jgi:hypothetical protein